MPLTRIASGLLARHEAGSSTHPFDPVDWEPAISITARLDAAGNLGLVGPDDGTYRGVRYLPVADRSRVFVRIAAAVEGTNMHLAPLAHLGSIDPETFAAVIFVLTVQRSVEVTQLGERQGLSTVNISSSNVPPRAAGTFYTATLYVDDDQAAGYDHGNALEKSGAIPLLRSGGVGVLHHATTSALQRLSLFLAMADRYVTVTGLPAGYSIRVGTFTAPADASGTAAVDLFAAELPQALVEVLDESGAVVESIAPEDGVWGGDVYEAGPRPDRPTITVVEPWINPVTLSGSPFSITGEGYADVVQSDNPVAYWRLGEPAGAAVAVDSVGSHDGAYEGAPVTGVTGLVSGSDTAADLSAGSVRVPGTEALRPAEVTIEAWFRPQGFIPSTPNHIAQHANAYILETNQLESARPQLAFFTGGGFLRITAPDPMEAGEVYHLVGTYDGEVARLYVNGVEVASDILGGIAYGEDDFFISQASPTSHGVLGVVDEVAVYAHALSPERVGAHYDAGRAHLASRWQVALETDLEFTAPIFDSGWDAEHLLEITIDEQLPAGVRLLARVAYRQRNGLDSEWSNLAGFVLSGWIPCPAPPDTEWGPCLASAQAFSEDFETGTLEQWDYVSPNTSVGIVDNPAQGRFAFRVDNLNQDPASGTAGVLTEPGDFASVIRKELVPARYGVVAFKFQILTFDEDDPGAFAITDASDAASLVVNPMRQTAQDAGNRFWVGARFYPRLDIGVWYAFRAAFDWESMTFDFELRDAEGVVVRSDSGVPFVGENFAKVWIYNQSDEPDGGASVWDDIYVGLWSACPTPPTTVWEAP